jgi:hypothetical protein
MVWHYKEGNLIVPDKNKGSKKYQLFSNRMIFYVKEDEVNTGNTSFEPFKVPENKEYALRSMEGIVQVWDTKTRSPLKEKIIQDFMPDTSFIGSYFKSNFELVNGVYVLDQAFTIYRLDSKSLVKNYKSMFELIILGGKTPEEINKMG